MHWAAAWIAVAAAEGNPACFIGGLTYEVCCEQRDPICFDPVYTFQYAAGGYANLLGEGHLRKHATSDL